MTTICKFLEWRWCGDVASTRVNKETNELIGALLPLRLSYLERVAELIEFPATKKEQQQLRGDYHGHSR